MEESDRRVETDPFQGGSHIVNQQGVEEREQSVHVVQGRSAAALPEEEMLLVCADERIEDAEVERCGVALNAPDLIDRGLILKRPDVLLHTVKGLLHRRIIGQLGPVSHRPLDDDAAVGDLGRHHRPGNLGARHGIVRPAVLLAPQEHVAIDRAMHAGEEATVFSQERQRHVPLAAKAHQKGTARDVAEADDGPQVVDRHTKLRLLLVADKNRITLLRKIRSLGRHEQCVEQLLHSSIPAFER